MQINVLFTDVSESVVRGYVADPQNLESFPYQGVIGTDDARWKAYYDAIPEMMRDGLPVPD